MLPRYPGAFMYILSPSIFIEKLSSFMAFSEDKQFCSTTMQCSVIVFAKDGFADCSLTRAKSSIKSSNARRTYSFVFLQKISGHLSEFNRNILSPF